MQKLRWALALVACLSLPALAAVNVNTATKEELDTLPGIGPAKAQAIVDHRQKFGPFKTVDDVRNVSGIGAKRLEKIRADITVGSAGQAGASAKATGLAAPGAGSAKVDPRAAAPSATGEVRSGAGKPAR